jgi:hypothetical protein
VSCGAGETAFEGRCYYRDTTNRTYAQARTACSNRGTGWHLATVSSAGENQFVAGLAGSNESWLGGSDSVTEGRFVWVTGETFWSGGVSGGPVNGAYENFDAGEPNNSGGVSGSDCLRIVPGGVWRDVSCNSGYRAICEKN